MELIPYKNFGDQDDQKMHSLIEPDSEGPWAVRYLWIQHRYENDKFFENYFSAGNQTGLNIRKQTTHLKSDWDRHNKIFYDSAENGNLVWRVKVGNRLSKSIDYIEIWKSKNILTNYFGNRDVDIDDQTTWKIETRKKFGEHLYDTGFDIRAWLPYPLISKKLAMQTYVKFIDRYKNQDMCIINTPWKRELNPL
jgi:hypothetical protein